MPLNVVLGAGLVGTGTITTGWVASPSSSWSVPFVMVVVPLTPDSEAVQLLATLVEENTSAPEVFVPAMLLDVVTDPVAPVVPWVLSVIGPEVKKMPGPYRASPVGAEAVTGTAEPVGGSITVGAAAHPTVLVGGFVHGRSAGGPPKRPILLK